MPQLTQPDWIAVDWGTSHLRVWAMDAEGNALDTRHSSAGMGALKPDAFEGALLNLIGDWLKDGQTTDLVACGMVGARQGWMEAAYRPVPCTPAGEGALIVPNTDPRIRMHILPGLMQAEPADVMRGEETQIAGYLATNPDFEGVICAPGTHSKWADIGYGKILSFQTCLSGEMFALLSRQSVLRHSIAEDGWDMDSFLQALEEAFSAPERVISSLFALRAGTLLHDLSPVAARARLSGLILGMELAATHTVWATRPVVIIGASELSAHYADAIRALGGHPAVVDGSAMTLAGLVSAHTQLQEQ